MAEIDNKLNDPLSTAPRAPSVNEALRQSQDIARQQVESTQRMGELEAEKLRKKPEIEAGLLQAQKEYRDTARKEKESDIASAEQDMSKFRVSQDSIMGMSALGTAILMIGQSLGRSGGQQSGINAIQSMTGMMQGYTQGRADEFKRNQVEFDRNFKILQEKVKRANDKFQAALAEMPYNTIEAQTKAAQALAELDSPILKEKYNKQGLAETAAFVNTLFQASEKAADRAQQLAIAQAKASGAGASLPKDKDAIAKYQARYRTVKNIEDIESLLTNPKYAKYIGPETKFTPEVINNLRGNFPELSQKLARIQAIEFEIGGKALTSAEQKILEPIYGWRGLTVNALKQRLAGIKEDFNDQLGVQEETYPGFKQLRPRLDAYYEKKGSTPDITEGTGDQDIKNEAVSRFGAYEPDKYDYGYENGRFYRDKK